MPLSVLSAVHTAFQGPGRERQLHGDAVGKGERENIEVGQEVCVAVLLRLEQSIHDFQCHDMASQSIVDDCSP